MVLEDATSSPTAMSQDTFRDDSSPASDFDPYSSSNEGGGGQRVFGTSNFPPNTTPPGYKIDVAKLPAPLPFFGTLFGFSPSRRLEAIHAAYSSMSAIVRRPLTKDECDSIAYHLSKGAAIHSWGEPLGLAAGYYRYNATRDTFRFPFWKPDLEKLDRDKLFGLRGARARAAWDLMRLASYGILSGYIGKLLVGTYAATVVAVGQRSDTRMQDIIEKIRVVGNEEAGRRVRASPEWERRRGGARGGSKVTDTRGAATEGVEDYGGVQPDGDVEGSPMNSGGLLSDREYRQQQQRVPPPSNTRARDPAPYQVDSRQESSGVFDFDDASPTAPMQDASSSSGTETRYSSRSAWDRLRRGGGPGPQTPQNPTTSSSGSRQSDAWAGIRGNAASGSGSSGSDSGRGGGSETEYSSIRSEEDDRSREREKAQKEFDERVERERRGEGFDGEGGSSRGRWR